MDAWQTPYVHVLHATCTAVTARMIVRSKCCFQVPIHNYDVVYGVFKFKGYIKVFHIHVGGYIPICNLSLHNYV